MKTQKFNVPLIPFELRREETAHQIADALEFLEKVTDEIFERISTQITEERKRIDGLNRRIGVAQAKVNKLKGTNKAIKVFASPKYPAEAEVTEYKSAFSGAKKELEELKRINYRVGARHPVFDDKVLHELRQTEMVTMKLKKKDKSRQEEEGLGRLPDDLGSISSLLLFNTTENPYKKFVFVDPLGKMSKTRALAEKQEGDGLADAPQSITSREALEKRRPEDISYIPVLGYVPDISVPDFLPLVGVAGDMLYSAEQGPSIAPSALPDLPSVTGSSGSSAALPSIASPAAAAQPPPPPPPPAAAPPPPPSSTAPAPPPPPPGGPPPPPPPPPSGAPPPIKLEDAPPEVTSGGGGRSDLLAAIRNAGGVGKAKLKGVKDRKMEKKKEKEQAKVASGGDLMGSLAATLAARRQAMSGNKTKPKGDDEDSRAAPPSAANMLKMMGDMIPAPSPNAPKQDDDEEDW